MDIGKAVEHLRGGGKVARAGWNGKNMHLFINYGGDSIRADGGRGLVMLPFVMMKTADDMLVPWLCSQTDLLATDWEGVVAA